LLAWKGETTHRRAAHARKEQICSLEKEKRRGPKDRQREEKSKGSNKPAERTKQAIAPVPNYRKTKSFSIDRKYML